MDNDINESSLDNIGASVAVNVPGIAINPPSPDLNNSRLNALQDNSPVLDPRPPPLSAQLSRLPENYDLYPFARDFSGAGIPRFREFPYHRSQVSPPPDNPVLDQTCEIDPFNPLFSYSLSIFYILLFLSIIIFSVVCIATIYEGPLTKFFRVFHILFRLFQLWEDFMNRFLSYLDGPLGSFPGLADLRDRTRDLVEPDPFPTRLFRNTSWVFSEIGGFLYRNGFRSFMTLASLFFGPFLFKHRKKYKKLGSSFWRRWLGR